MVRLDGIADLAAAFVRVRLVKISGVDLRIFDFDFDLTLTVFFLHPDGKVYGRYGCRDASDPDARNSLPGLRHAMQAALAAHRQYQPPRLSPASQAPLLVERLPVARKYGGCIHCHQVAEIFRAEQKNAGTWKREDLWVYPLPENVGLKLERDRGNAVQTVKEGSPANRAGLKTGDLLRTLNELPVASQADVMYALHRSPAQGEITVSWQRGQQSFSGKLTLPAGWRHTNLTWRPSLLDLLPALTVFGEDLTEKEKKDLGLSPGRLAFRQHSPVHSAAQVMGVRAGDIIIGIDNQVLEMTVTEFLGHVRRNFLLGDRLTLNLLRAGKRVDLPITLR